MSGGVLGEQFPFEVYQSFDVAGFGNLDSRHRRTVARLERFEPSNFTRAVTQAASSIGHDAGGDCVCGLCEVQFDALRTCWKRSSEILACCQQRRSRAPTSAWRYTPSIRPHCWTYSLDDRGADLPRCTANGAARRQTSAAGTKQRFLI